MSFAFGFANSNRAITAADNRENRNISHDDTAHCALATLVQSAAPDCGKGM